MHYGTTGDSGDRHHTRSGSLDTIDDTHSGCESDTGGSTMTSRQTTPHDEEPQQDCGQETQDDGERPTSHLDDLVAMGDRRTIGHEATTLEITVDAGAAEVVAPHTLRKGPGLARGTGPLAVPWLDEEKVRMATEAGGVHDMTFHVSGRCHDATRAGRANCEQRAHDRLG